MTHETNQEGVMSIELKARISAFVHTAGSVLLRVLANASASATVPRVRLV